MRHALVALLLLFAGLLPAQVWTAGVSGSFDSSRRAVGYAHVAYYPDPVLSLYALGGAGGGQKEARAGMSMAVWEHSHGYLRLFGEAGAAHGFQRFGFSGAVGLSPQFLWNGGKYGPPISLEPFVRAKYQLGRGAIEAGLGIQFFLRRWK